MKKHLLTKVTALLVVVLLAIPASALALAEMPSERKLRQMGIQFLSASSGDTQTVVTGSVAGSGSCYELATPQINDQAAFAAAIESYISSKQSESPFATLGADIVQGSVRHGVNPMFIVGNLRMESQFGTTGQGGGNGLSDLLHQNYNAFGRRGNKSKPHFDAANGSPWYKYPSWKDSVNSPESSVDNTTDQPSLMRKVYLDDGLLTIGQYLGRYAPASDGNDESVYATTMRDVITAIITLAGPSLTCQDAATVVTPAPVEAAP